MEACAVVRAERAYLGGSAVGVHSLIRRYISELTQQGQQGLRYVLVLDYCHQLKFGGHTHRPLPLTNKQKLSRRRHNYKPPFPIIIQNSPTISDLY
jgi:hypothetical protein